ncbi:MAG: GTPase HflX [Verrucomicrobia bacterium]|nr:GTPase HflX [Verrucomicrobiota bacterium]
MTELIETQGEEPERVVLVGVQLRSADAWTVQDHLSELGQLVQTAGGLVVAQEIVKRDRPTAPYFIGKGKVEDLRLICEAERADTVVFDEELAPAQERNLEREVKRKIISRTGLILDIFAQRAQTREAKLQVELAQHQYMLPRLRGLWTHLERQPGGIGTRGPGETQIEVDRRRVREQIQRLTNEIGAVRRSRATQRKARARHDVRTVAIIGYTNAGKSTLLNRLTGADAFVEDKVFATLDPTTRKLEIPSGRAVLFSDTVGFIRKLPHMLVDAFKATFEETLEADLLLHVLDISHPAADEQAEAVAAVLKELGAEEKPIVTALNKTDRIEHPEIAGRWVRQLGHAVPVSAKHGTGLRELLDLIEAQFATEMLTATYRVPQSESRLVARLHAEGHVLSTKWENNSALVTVELRRERAAAFERFLVKTDSP